MTMYDESPVKRRIAIIGAGAAGCFAAANIPAGHEVIVFEKGGRPMQKVKVSGGGRCNVTHACFDIPELIRRYPRGQSLLKQTIIDAIWSALMKAGVQVHFSKAVQAAVPAGNGWELRFADGGTHTCDRLLLAPGSLQKPEGWGWLTALGHTIQPPAPSLFTFNIPGNAITQLMGARRD